MRPSPEVALALVRLVTGLVFGWHGYHKIFELGLGAVTDSYRAAGVPLPLLVAPLSAVLQLVGGPLLVLGLGARGLAGGLALLTVLVAIPVLTPGRFDPEALGEPLLLLAGSLAVVLGGPGFPVLRDRSGPVLPPSPTTGSRKRS